MAKKKSTKIRKRQQKVMKQKTVFCAFLLILVITISYIILKTNILEPQVNQLTTSYISFNNRNATDMLTITNLKKMNNKKGNSIFNNTKISFQIHGDQKKDYEIILIPRKNTIEEKYIHYTLVIDDKTITGTLDKNPEKTIGERTIYKGNSSKKTKVLLRMWVSEDYQHKVENSSFEIKVK